MRKILLTALLFTLCNIALAQDVEAIKDVLNKQRTAWNNGDIEGYMQYYWKSDSLLFVGKRGPTYGWQNTLNNYKKGYPDKAAMGILSFNIIKVELLGNNNAFVLGGWQLQRDTDKPGGYFTLWFRKIDGQWKIAADHSS
ncbi:DUF4440 domain-containing protein [Mucilaginibacter limnophilus]|uniref:DUF4440 domain-containing protein n=1 Tax=Mucilaginibacter limnophilus TaxID=1932778 RepID=A0A3S2V8Z4_9SPHI|nr:DUF4440 domain-containing protein [Mucilaginibacter limnophilus]RVU01559.1 DUF4440 domain-containing protein [Mucilaginibacter limnophilus]